MKYGDIVHLIGYNDMLGEIISTDQNKVTLRMCDTGLNITVNQLDVKLTDRKQPHRGNSFVDVLGTQYSIVVLSKDDYRNNGDKSGWCDPFTKQIQILNYKQDINSVDDLSRYQDDILRHEIVHAFLYESGLWSCSKDVECWAMNEEMVDWIAIQAPKLHKAFKEAGCDK